MHSSENAFDRVKSLLGKMDRSIDDARRRRLDEHPGEGSDDDHTHAEQKETMGGAERRDETAAAPPRPTSKYGRARPLREVNGAGPNWKTA